MNIRYLPIGSVIKLKNNNKSIMITGYYSVEYARDLEIYDYTNINSSEYANKLKK